MGDQRGRGLRRPLLHGRLQFAPAVTVCRSATSVCDVAETCSGSSAACPANVFVPNGTSCSDGDVCDGAEMCQAGACMPGTPLVCNDGNVCTDDACDPGTGCYFLDNTAPCSDGVACTSDVCSRGTCQSTSTWTQHVLRCHPGVCSGSSVRIWADDDVPDHFEGPDLASELGVKFRSDVAGFITGIRFYRSRATAAHVETCGRRPERGSRWRPSPMKRLRAGSR